jgi:tripartite-type tricarboxylate transporter receptor subunit TctC
VGSVAGGGNDLVGRLLAHRLSESLRQQVVVDNRGGANGIIGMELVAKAAPDGHTLFMGTAGHLSVNPALYPDMPFDIGRDFSPLTAVVSLPLLLYSHPSLPVKTLGELIAHAKANPGKVSWSSSGTGGLPHLAGALLNSATGIDTRPGAVLHRRGVDRFAACEGGQVAGSRHHRTGTPAPIAGCRRVE